MRDPRKGQGLQEEVVEPGVEAVGVQEAVVEAEEGEDLVVPPGARQGLSHFLNFKLNVL